MSDPTYEYIRGLGWQPFPSYTGVEFITKDGHKYRLEVRMPEIGDLCLYFYDDGLYCKDKKPNLEALRNYYAATTVVPQNTHTCTAQLLMHYENAVWITIVKL